MAKSIYIFDRNAIFVFTGIFYISKRFLNRCLLNSNLLFILKGFIFYLFPALHLFLSQNRFDQSWSVIITYNCYHVCVPKPWTDYNGYNVGAVL